MKIEPRGKFGGVKVHLDAAECNLLLGWSKMHVGKKTIDTPLSTIQGFSMRLPLELAGKIIKLQKEVPNLLQDKSEDEIKKELLLEKQKSEKKLAAMAAGTKWDPAKGIKVEVD